MPRNLVNTKYMLLDAQQKGYAVPAFNIHNLETLQTVAETCARLGSPLILAATPSTFAFAGRDYIQAMAEAAARRHDIPIALHLDHHEDITQICQSLELGVTSVMIDASMKPYDQNVAIVREVVALAHSYGATVEAELGRLSGQEDDLLVEDGDSAYTSPGQAVDFVAKTGIDSLAVAIGTAHGVYETKPVLDVERLSEIRALVGVPLVLHGASDVPGQDVAECVRRGICKVNIATDLKIPFSGALKAFFLENPQESDPRKFMAPAKAAVARVVEEKIAICQSGGRA